MQISDLRNHVQVQTPSEKAEVAQIQSIFLKV